MPDKDALYFFVFVIDINANRGATIWWLEILKHSMKPEFIGSQHIFNYKILLTDLQGRYKL